ncbi:MAG: SAM-dependent methyltransferase [Betaproteobacteria bacterium]|nr:SAM-dependent methyltransferase [Betaproteobacteria bacterium]
MPAPSSPSSLPAPDAAALAHSGRLLDHVRGELDASGGWISFARYMELVLYAPGLGYYVGGAAKFGGAGDFVTAPELTPLFGRTLARVAAQALARTGGDLLELGAGSGRLALDVLLQLERLESLPERYLILEVSPDLRARQRQLLAEQAPHLLPRVAWLDALPESLRGVVLGNEVLDALPVHLLHGSAEGVLERGVVWTEVGLAWADRPIASPALASAVAELPVVTDRRVGGYLSELNLAAPALVASLADRLECGLLLFLDYGYPRAEYYHPQRHMGTLRAHYRQHALDDPFFLPGLADLTAHVDFSTVARAGQEAGLDLLGYTSQANFLMDAGILELMLEMEPMTPPYLRAASAVQRLLQPSEMGELFKAIALGRGLTAELPGFRRGDRRAAL